MKSDKRWYVKTDEGYVEGVDAMTFLEAVWLADFLVAKDHKGVTIIQGQPQLEIK